MIVASTIVPSRRNQARLGDVDDATLPRGWSRTATGTGITSSGLRVGTMRTAAHSATQLPAPWD